MTTATFDLPATLNARKHFKTYSVFNAWRSSEAVNVIFVHRDESKERKSPVSGSFHKEGKVLSVDLSADAYDDLWSEIWGHTDSVLTVKLEDNQVTQFSVKRRGNRGYQND